MNVRAEPFDSAVRGERKALEWNHEQPEFILSEVEGLRTGCREWSRSMNANARSGFTLRCSPSPAAADSRTVSMLAVVIDLRETAVQLAILFENLR